MFTITDTPPYDGLYTYLLNDDIDGDGYNDFYFNIMGYIYTVLSGKQEIFKDYKFRSRKQKLF